VRAREKRNLAAPNRVEAISYGTADNQFAENFGQDLQKKFQAFKADAQKA
jgi:hypothetical protein